MSKGKNFIVGLEVYPFDIMFSVGQSDKDFKKELKKHLMKKHFKQMSVDGIMLMQNQPAANGRTIRLRGGQTTIRIVGDIDSPNMHGTVAHEIFHAVEFLFRRIEIKLCNKSDEAFAYLIGFITKKFYEGLNEH